LITLAIRSLLSFIDSRFCSTWFYTFKSSFLSFRMAPGVYLVGFFLWVLLPILSSFDLFGVLDAYHIVVSYRYLSLFALRAVIVFFVVRDGLPRLGKLVCQAIVHSLGVWLCYFSSALKPLHWWVSRWRVFVPICCSCFSYSVGWGY